MRGTVGSTVHGLNLPGKDDRDEMGICIEPPEHVIGLKNFEQWVYRDQPEGHPSGPGDLDLTIYSLRKFVKLAAQGNPTLLTLLFCPVTVKHQLAYELRNAHAQFASRQAGHRFRGYLTAQKQRLTGERGGMRVNRHNLVAEFGYDTKFAMHALRLGYQGVEFLTTGRLTFPMPEPARTYCYQVREGRKSFEEVLETIGWLEGKLDELIVGQSPLPEHPKWEELNGFLVYAYQRFWKEQKWV